MTIPMNDAGDHPLTPFGVEHVLRSLVGEHPGWRFRETSSRSVNSKHVYTVVVGVASPEAEQALVSRCRAAGVPIREE